MFPLLPADQIRKLYRQEEEADLLTPQRVGNFIAALSATPKLKNVQGVNLTTLALNVPGERGAQPWVCSLGPPPEPQAGWRLEPAAGAPPLGAACPARRPAPG